MSQARGRCLDVGVWAMGWDLREEFEIESSWRHQGGEKGWKNLRTSLMLTTVISLFSNAPHVVRIIDRAAM
ncbi:MAG: hypothetical protein D6728_03060 [Cyanobacteria bacterium J055]|nr:MAG: hypothetical protein D6728_03060 [Cyanobacteria bacterium J055]